ncbi:helicase-exonuclease AddAB subunit AddA [Oscillibacter sp.]|uniref:helicase-exonuclease AddAB subunit AddA n=1 Tax=Oscillibacter sp. TaxID=1945593 RepID=UPI00339778CD
MANIQLTDAQRAAVENRGGSLLVSAAAGSGKTKVLVERLFLYILEDGCNIDDFLMITYTKAAAAELRSKIASELGKLLGENPGNAHLRRQLLRVYQADIKTVDAFCTALLRENVHLLARDGEKYCLTPDFRVLDEGEAALLRRRVLDRTLEDFYKKLVETPGAELLADTLGAGRDDGALAELVLELHGKLQSHAYPQRWLEENREKWEHLSGVFDETPYAAELLAGVARRAASWSKILRCGAESVESDIALHTGYGEKFLSAADSLDALRDAAQGWDSAGNMAEAVDFPHLTTPKGRKDDPEVLRLKTLWDECKADVKKLRTLLAVTGGEAMEDLQAVAPAMAALLALTAEFSRRYRNEKLRLNAADFSDQEHLALELLTNEDGNTTELGEQVSARYREILVDEYQDTNEVQNHIFQAVSREGKNLFTVGDVKQSIYRFRLADPTIFLRKYAAFKSHADAAEGEERKILLSQNFRSRKEILDAANFIFENIMSPELGEIKYGEDEKLHFGAAYYPERNDCTTEYHLISARQRSAELERPVKKGVAEARLAAQRIWQLLDEKYPITGEDGTLRPCRPEDIVILMRSPGSRAAVFAAALAERGVPCSFQERGDYFSSMEVSTLLSLLHVIDNPRQDVPLIAVLRSPLFGFTPDRLARVRASSAAGDYYDAVTSDGGEDCRAFLETLDRLRLLARDMSVERLLWHIYNELNVLGVFGAMDRGEERKENLIALTEHAEKFESNGCRGLFLFLEQLQKLIDSDQAPATRGKSELGGVRLMSVHKSKGLEFPIVLLCDLDRTFSRMDFDTPVLVHPELGLGPRRVDLDRHIHYPTMARRAIEEKLRRENQSEEQRILYVAMTRPKEKLILLHSLYHTQSTLKRLASLAACPVPPETAAGCRSYGEWLLLPLLCRPEAKPLRDLAGVEPENLCAGDESPWQVFLHDSEDFREILPIRTERRKTGDEGCADLSLLDRSYPYEAATRLPAKRTATQLKGREKDDEAAENAPRPPALRPLDQPRFRQERQGLTPTERGTAVHLALQYLNFADPDAVGQVAALREKRLLTPQQADCVDVGQLEALLASPLAEDIRSGKNVLREYPFTVLISASELDADAGDDQVLLQGVVDCCFETAEGLTVVDFKTDRVFEEDVRRRAEHYRPQLEAYSAALERVLEKKVVRRALYFLSPGETVNL